MEIAICDDEEAVQKKLKQLIKKNLPQSRIAVYDSGQQLLKSQEEYDIVFLDICMAELDGIETAKILRHLLAGGKELADGKWDLCHQPALCRLLLEN